MEVCELTYSRASAAPARWVLAVPDESPAQTPQDLEALRSRAELMKDVHDA